MTLVGGELTQRQKSGGGDDFKFAMIIVYDLKEGIYVPYFVNRSEWPLYLSSCRSVLTAASSEPEARLPVGKTFLASIA